MTEEPKSTTMEIMKKELPSIKQVLSLILKNISKDTDAYHFISGLKEAYETLFYTIITDAKDHYVKFSIPVNRITPQVTHLKEIPFIPLMKDLKEQIKILPMYGGGLNGNLDFEFVITLPKKLTLPLVDSKDQSLEVVNPNE